MTTSVKKKEELLWEQLPGDAFSSHRVREIGFGMFYDRADRTCRGWAEVGRLRRIPKEECVLRGLIKNGHAPLAWWEKI